jgi:acyl-CoA reductase-like NAD-dependent aldehyde dehydrogenase
MSLNYPLFINGEFKDTLFKQDIINPATGEVLAKVSAATEKDIDRIIESARLAFDKGPWQGISLAQRKEFLLKNR